MTNKGTGHSIDHGLHRLTTQHLQATTRVVRFLEVIQDYLPLLTQQRLNQILHFFITQQTKLNTVLKVNQAVADVVGGFEQIHQWMTTPRVLASRQQPKSGSDLFQYWQFRIKAAKFLFFATRNIVDRPGVLEKSAKRSVSQTHSALKPVILHLSNDAETLSITLIGLEISSFVRAEALKKMRVTRIYKKMPDSIFSRMSVRRVTDIVSQTRGLNHSTDVTGIHMTGQLLTQHLPYSDTQRTPYTTNFQAVCQSRMNMIILTQRMHLSFSVETTES